MGVNGLAYLGDKRWVDITREERFFCMQLYMDIMKNGGEKRFIEIINRLCSPGKSENHFDPHENWELGYEVCFFRDIWHHLPKETRGEMQSPKRTFDLCLMSDRNIIIIEAKCAERFKKNQVEDFAADIVRFKNLRESVPEMNEVKITLLGLVAKEYVERLKNRNITWLYNENYFGNDYRFMTWEDLAEEYKDLLLLNAGKIYKK